ncbi:glycosyltransferase [Micromonospora sp. NPDC049048]|uniref:glycosyltransferase n=1 Tax=Micromonospora sp. NPDC049048 TaxID=3364263 RepID=UPI003722035F
MTDSSDWVAYVGPFRYPWGEACSRRVDGIARSLALAGRHVVVVGGEHTPAEPRPVEVAAGPGTITHVGVGELPPVGASPAAKATQVLLRWGARTVAWLAAQPTRPSHVVVYGGGTPYMVHLRRWCRRHGVPLVVDVVEWYSPRQLAGGALGPLHLSAKLALRHHYPRCSGVIAISTLLEEHFRRRGCPVVRVPPTLDVRQLAVAPQLPPTERDELTLVYAGTPGRKDLLGTVVQAVEAVVRSGARLRLRVVGPSRRQLRDLLGTEPPEMVEVVGRVPQWTVPQLLREADFSVLLRPPARYANAGFPTKVCESMANGTPVICNLTSDLGRYLEDGVNALVCADHSVNALAATLHRAVRLTAEERLLIRKAAREQALDSFDVRVYAQPLARLLDTVRETSGTGHGGR